MPNADQIVEAPRVDLAVAKERFDQGTAIFIDVRGLDAFEESHIRGALSLPLPEIARRASELPRDREIILY